MGKVTGIQWCRYTYNPWEGCQHDGPGCANCYAEARNRRFSGGANWGPHAPRRRTGSAGRRDVLSWHAAARAAAKPETVFAASIADIFDPHPSIADNWSADFWSLVQGTPWLIWLIVTKRIRHAAHLLPPDWGDGYPNVMLISTVCRHAEASRDIPILLKTPAAARGLSMEPLLERTQLRRLRIGRGVQLDALTGCHEAFVSTLGGFASVSEVLAALPALPPRLPALDWVILGGESGPGARMTWVPHLRNALQQCQSVGTPAFMKQMGSVVGDRNDAGFDGCEPESWDLDDEFYQVQHDIGGFRDDAQGAPVRIKLRDRKGGDPNEWPQDLRVRQFPAYFERYTDDLRRAA